MLKRFRNADLLLARAELCAENFISFFLEQCKFGKKDLFQAGAIRQRATESLKTDTDNPLTYETAPTTNQVEVNDLSKLLNRAIQELPEEQKEVIDLAFFKGMSQCEIAAKRQISLGTVKTRLHLAQRKMHNYQLPSTDAEQDLRSVERLKRVF
jgi:RNA polymerase sigma factor (sigma-70 family)